MQKSPSEEKVFWIILLLVISVIEDTSRMKLYSKNISKSCFSTHAFKTVERISSHQVSR